MEEFSSDFFLQNDSCLNLDNLSDIEYQGVHIFCMILPNVPDCQVKDHLQRFYLNLVLKTKVCWFELSLAKTKFLH